MKKIITAAMLVLSINIFSQNINGKLGINGQFIIRDTNNTFLTLPQNTGYLNLNRSLVLPNTTSSSIGVLYKANEIFMHNYGVQNTFLGISTGNLTMAGIRNTAMGYYALPLTTSGQENSAFGNGALRYSTTGENNSAFGNASLFSNTTGHFNTAIGSWALYSNTTGEGNIAIGYRALYTNTTGTNNIAIGFNTMVPSAIGNNQVRIGNSLITYAGIQVAWSITSDRNLKDNILSSNLGLGFINKLRPVSYNRRNDESNKTEYGLIAQEVEETLKQEGVENSAMLTVTESGEYQLRYNDLLAPMIKAIQELNEKNEKLSAENNLLKAENNTLNERLAKIEQVQSTLSTEIEQINKEILKHSIQPENKTIILNSN